MKENIIKSLITLLLLISYFFLPKYGFTSFEGLGTHLLYPFSHVNIFHLAANILCLWMLRCRTHVLLTYCIAVAASFLPSFCLYGLIAGQGYALTEPTYGYSGVIFAMVGISWGKANRFRDMLWRNKWYLIIPAFVPHVNFLIHIYCLIGGYGAGVAVTQRHTGHSEKGSEKGNEKAQTGRKTQDGAGKGKQHKGI
jgi:membrane associated rhomboid family serine protease